MKSATVLFSFTFYKFFASKHSQSTSGNISTLGRFGMQEKKLYAGGIRHSIRLLFSREQRAAGQRDMGVGLSPRPIVPC